MRVLYLSINPNLGSSTRTLQDWMLLGRTRGLEPFVCLRSHGPFADWLDANKIPWRVDPLSWPSWSHPWRTLRRNFGLLRWCHRHKIEVIHAEHDVYPVASALARVLQCPKICHFHFGVSREFCDWAFAGQRCPTAAIWTSQQQKLDCAQSTVRTLSEENQFVIPLGVDVDTFGVRHATRGSMREEWRLQPEDIVFGMASAIQPRKRTLAFVEMVCEAAARNANVKAVLAGDARPGDEEYKRLVVRRIAESGLADRFRLVGRLVDVETFFHAIDVYVSTSEYETFGMSVCEAMACRKPILACRGGSIHEVVGDAGLIVENDALQDLSSGAIRLAQDASLRAKLGDKARDRVIERFSPRATLAQILDIYESALASPVR